MMQGIQRCWSALMYDERTETFEETRWDALLVEHGCVLCRGGGDGET
jgi:hypothetical protein